VKSSPSHTKQIGLVPSLVLAKNGSMVEGDSTPVVQGGATPIEKPQAKLMKYYAYVDNIK
jgi:hypothetical protein